MAVSLRLPQNRLDGAGCLQDTMAMVKTESLSNHFLIAMPSLEDPNFHHTTTYICEHDENGALGIIINRPLKMNLGEILIAEGRSEEAERILRAGIDSQSYDPSIDGTPLRNKYGILPDDTVLFFMGWLYHFSGLKETALELVASDKNMKMLIVGDGDAYDDLMSIRAKHNLEDRIILTGRRPFKEMPSLIATADICILPAYSWEPIMQDIVPIKMYEYMAMKKPVICSKLYGVMKEFGQDNGVVYIDRPEDTIKKAVELVNNGSIKELGAKARRFVERNSWDQITDEFEVILKEVIESKRAASNLSRKS